MALAYGSDPGERERLIVAHLPLVEAVARRFAHHGERREDLVQVGALALVRAVDRRDPDRADTLTGYLARCVEGEIRRHLRDRACAVRLPRRVQELDGRVRAAGDALTASLGHEPTAAEVARAAGVAVDDVASTAAAQTARRPLTLSERDADVGDDAAEDAWVARALVARAAGALDARERRLVLLRYYLDWSQAEVGEALGISQAHVSRLLDRALAKMRRRLGGTGALAHDARGATLGGDGNGGTSEGAAGAALDRAVAR